jgi:hypothetical protein
VIRELLDRTLIWNRSRLLHVLREFKQFYNWHRPQQGIANARPLQPLPVPLVAPEPGRYFRSCRAMTMRWIWLVPS